MIGLVLGDTQLGRLIVKNLISLNIKFVIIDISKKKIFKKNKNSFSLSIGQMGKAISILKKNKVKKLIFAGKVAKPNYKKIKFDLKALYYLPKIINATKKGDVFLIKEIIKIFTKQGFKVIDSLFFNKELALKKGCYTKTKPNSLNKKDIIKAKKIIDDLKKSKSGQGVIVRKGYVIGIEGPEGTDAMLKTANILIRRISYKKKREGILLKFPKKNQDLRIDLPTVGIKTINNCKKIGLKGIIVKAKQNIFLDKTKCINLANRNKMFICAV